MDSEFSAMLIEMRRLNTEFLDAIIASREAGYTRQELRVGITDLRYHLQETRTFPPTTPNEQRVHRDDYTEHCSDGMKVLVRIDSTRGLAAHIPNATGHPLCKLNLNVARWTIVDYNPDTIIICRNCQQVQARTTPKPPRQESGS